MDDEQVVATEQTESQTDTQDTQEDGLEAVYKKYNVDEVAKQFQSTPQQPQFPQARTEQPVNQISPPDPALDPEGYKRWELDRYKEVSEVRNAVSYMAQQLQSDRQAQAKAREEADIRKAVDVINGHLGDNKLDPDIIEVNLGVMAKKDPRFLTVWANREQNPKAWSEALKEASKRMAKFANARVDTQLVENVRALKEATKTKAVSDQPKDTVEERLGRLTGRDFEMEIERIRRGY